MKNLLYKTKNSNKFDKFILFGLNSISLLGIGIGIAVIIVVIITIYAMWYIMAPKNVLKSLEELYQGEKFEIIEDFGAENNHSRGLYIVSPKNNKEIKFKFYNTNQLRNDNDYSAYRMKYYIEHCTDEKLLEGIKTKEETYKYDGIEFLNYSVYLELNNYYEIEEKTEKAYKLAKYLHTQNSKMSESIILNPKNFISIICINCNTDKSLDEEIYQVKYDYIESLNNAVKNPDLFFGTKKEKELQEIGKAEIDKIWKPKYMNIVVNEKETAEKAEYNLEDKKYNFIKTTELLTKIDKIEINKRSIFTRKIKKIKYNNKIYKIKEGSNKGKYKNDVIYTDDNIDDICKKLNVEVKYDYENQKIYINL